jgi:glycine cleavage system regulatory protein
MSADPLDVDMDVDDPDDNGLNERPIVKRISAAERIERAAHGIVDKLTAALRRRDERIAELESRIVALENAKARRGKGRGKQKGHD